MYLGNLSLRVPVCVLRIIRRIERQSYPTSGLLPFGRVILKTNIWLSKFSPDLSINRVLPKLINPSPRGLAASQHGYPNIRQKRTILSDKVIVRGCKQEVLLSIVLPIFILDWDQSNALPFLIQQPAIPRTAVVQAKSTQLRFDVEIDEWTDCRGRNIRV